MSHFLFNRFDKNFFLLNRAIWKSRPQKERQKQPLRRSNPGGSLTDKKISQVMGGQSEFEQAGQKSLLLIVNFTNCLLWLFVHDIDLKYN